MSLIGNNHGSFAFSSPPFSKSKVFLYSVWGGGNVGRERKEKEAKELSSPDSALTVLSDDSNCMFQTNDSLSFVLPPDLIYIFLFCFQF